MYPITWIPLLVSQCWIRAVCCFSIRSSCKHHDTVQTHIHNSFSFAQEVMLFDVSCFFLYTSTACSSTLSRAYLVCLPWCFALVRSLIFHQSMPSSRTWMFRGYGYMWHIESEDGTCSFHQIVSLILSSC